MTSAEQNYANFVRLYQSETADKKLMYSFLWDSYKEYLSFLNGAGSSGMVKEKLRIIYPHLVNGAAYFSQCGRTTEAMEFAKAYVNMPKQAAFQGERFTRSENYPTIVYYAATGTFNSRQFSEAITYFQDYLETGETSRLQDCYYYMSKAYYYNKDYIRQQQILEAGIVRLPSNVRLIYEMINLCIERRLTDRLEIYVNKALSLNPKDMNVLPMKAKLLADKGQLEDALNLYTMIYSRNSADLKIIKQYATVCYNYAATLINGANAVENQRQYAQQRQKANQYLNTAVELFQKILQKEPASVKYLSALADTYKCLGQTTEAERTIRKIQMNGGTYIASATAINAGKKTSGTERTPIEQNVSSDISRNTTFRIFPQEIPLFSSFAKNFVEKEINAWQVKDDYETLSEYRLRVSEEKREAKIRELARKAENDYIARYGQYVDWNTLKLEKYDAENGVFLIVDPRWGNLLLPVPRTNDEARQFERQWNNVKTLNPQFFITDDRLALAEITFRTPAGRSYTYSNKASLTYQTTQIDYNFDKVDLAEIQTATSETSRPVPSVTTRKVSVGKSDVDIEIPLSKNVNENTFAVIISNENYRRESEVEFAHNDGEIFRQYCIKTLGMPENNVHYVPDATYNDIKVELDWLSQVAQAYGSNASLVFYYAGHGIPDEETHSAYLLPVDGYGANVSTAYSLNKLYETLAGMPAKSATVFLDACFSGSKRDGQMMASSARGVAIKADSGKPQGNVVVISAATGNQTAYPYREKKHGLFTYFLLKKLQDTKGKVDYGELMEYIQTEVARKSIVVNKKSQTPTVIPSVTIGDKWKKWNLK